MANTIKLKRSGSAGDSPTSGELQHGELGLNYADGKLFFKNSSNVIQELLTSPGTSNGQILFTNTSSNFEGDNSLFWDNTNNRLGIGTNSPGYDLTIDNVFDTCYFKTYKYDIENLRIYIKQMYSAFASISPVVVKESAAFKNSNCHSYGQPDFVASQREKLNDQKYDEDYNELFWLKLYYRIKLKELEVKTPDSLLTREMLKLEQLHISLDFDSALNYINDKMKSQIPWI